MGETAPTTLPRNWYSSTDIFALERMGARVVGPDEARAKIGLT